MPAYAGLTLGYCRPHRQATERRPHVLHWIDTPEALQQRLPGRPHRLGLDTEFIRERTYWPQLALVQMAVDDDIFLLDALAPGIPETLAPLLTDPAVLKIMHSASEDLVAFLRACGVTPRPLFDTQIAAALAGTGAGLGYQKLVHALTGVTLPKGETRSDWLRRPLSESQLAYAADDVRHLFALHDQLGARLDELGRADWLAQDAERLLEATERSDAGDPWPHLAMRSTQYLPSEAQRRLLRLLRWREAQARRSDRPRSWILDNELAVTLARTPPRDRAALQALLDATPKAPRKLGDALWQALETPLEDEASAPLVQAAGETDKTVLKRLQDAVARRGAELGLADGVLASRRHLEALLQADRRGHEAWPAALNGWRRPLLEPLLRPLLAPAPTSG